MVEFDSIKIKDQLGRPEDKNINIKRKTETLVVESNTVHINKKSLGNSWIVGSATNGLVGTNTATEGGGQQVVGASGRVDVLQRVVNPNKIYREHLRDTFYRDDSAGNTADWDTTNFRIAMSDSSNHATVYNTIATSGSVAYADGTITKATFSVDETKWNPNDQIILRACADGSSWEDVTNGTEHSFEVTGTDGRWMIIFIGNGGNLTWVEEPRISYG